jgi:uncharacterized protein YgiM (DUF1202 family)
MERMVIGGAKVYSGKGHEFDIVNEIKDGQIVELGSVFSDNGSEWIEVMNGSDVTGYISGETKLINLKKYFYVIWDTLLCYESPSLDSGVSIQLNRDEELYLVEKVLKDEETWFKIYDKYGMSGYIKGTSGIHPRDFSPYDAIIGEDSVTVYKLPHVRDSDVFTKINRGLKVTVNRVVDHGDIKGWLEISFYGKTGYIPRTTHIEKAIDYSWTGVDKGKEDNHILEFIDYNKFTILGIISLFFAFLFLLVFHLGLLFVLPLITAGVTLIVKDKLLD